MRKRIVNRNFLCLICALVLVGANLPFTFPQIQKRAISEADSARRIGKSKDRLLFEIPHIKSAYDDAGEPEEETARSSEEDVDGRDDWFMFQRMYPSNTFPQDGRLRAWKSIPRFHTDSEFTPSASRGWRLIGPAPTGSAFPNNWGPTSGRINAIAVSPANSRVVLVGSATGGIWRSSDGGATFEPVTDDQVDLAVGCITFSPSNSSIVYAGMGDMKGGYLGSGVLKSTDEGRTWMRVNNSTLPQPGTIAKIEVDPNNSNRVYLAQYTRLATDKVTSSGVYISTDGGTNWQKTLTGGARDVAIDAGNAQTIYAGLMRIDLLNDPTPGLYRSTDRGSTWANVIPVGYEPGKRRDMKIAVSPANPQMIYVYMGGWIGSNFDVAFLVSTDGGKNWADRGVWQFDTGQFGYNTFVAADPRNANTVYLGSRDVYRSTDGGFNWTNLTRNFLPFAGFYDYSPESSKTHPDQHAFAFSPNSSGQFYVGNDGGVAKTTDGGATFQSLNQTLALTQFTGVSIHPNDPSVSIAGSQDNGTQRRYHGGQWFEILHGDGGRSVFNSADPSMVFITRQRGSIIRMLGDGQAYDIQVAWDDYFGEVFGAGRMSFYPPFVGNGIDQKLYFGTWRLFTSDDLGATWIAPAGDTDLTKGVNEKGQDVLTAIAVARASTNVIYTGSAQGRAMRSTDGGATWTDVTRGLPDRSITSIAVHPANPAIAYLSLSGFNASHIFKTTDMGATWTSASAGLPDIPTNALIIDPVAPETVYAGTDVGVFQSANAGASWQSFNKGMPPVIITGFAAHSSGLIQAATYGRGIYEMTGLERPLISSVVFNGKKRLDITGSGFDEAPRVLINGLDKTDKIASVSETAIAVVSKLKKSGLKSGDNTIQIINSNNAASNIFTLRLDL